MPSIFSYRLPGILLLGILIFSAGCQASETLPTPTPASTLETQTPAPPASAPTPASTPTAQLTTGSPRPLILAHYMPWYQTPEGHGYWGWHWTMDHFRPDQEDENGRPEIASHYTPVIGPYDSSDQAVLEYQTLLMKLSGIDGVIVDWYGMENFWDYQAINESTGLLFRAVEKAGLQFSICYEDQTIKHMVDNQHLDGGEAYEHGQEVMRYLQDTWFGQEAYLKASNRPVLFTFGPQYFTNPTDWETLFSVLDLPPVFITLDGHASPSAAGSFPWPPMWASQNGVLSQAALESYLNTFYQEAKMWDFKVGGAFPGFHDIYKEAGNGEGYGFLDAQQGQTFRTTLQAAIEQNPDLIQLITWNDYGEGTIIEPTLEFGARYLEIIQEARRAMSGAEFTFEAADLGLPFKLYQLRKKYAGEAEVNASLDQVYSAIVAGDLEEAESLLARIP